MYPLKISTDFSIDDSTDFNNDTDLDINDDIDFGKEDNNNSNIFSNDELDGNITDKNDKVQIRSSKKGSKSQGSGRSVMYPLLEHKLYKEFLELREKGIKIRSMWFMTRAKQLFSDLYPRKFDDEGKLLFKFSEAWFDAFKLRYNISLRLFHYFIHEQAVKGNSIRLLGKWKLSGIANMDQTLIEFDMCAKDATYETRGAKTVWVKSSGSGLDKRQATVQLTIFVDGLKRVQPLIVFCGKDLHISQKKKSSWDHRVTVQFQDNA
ncbi:7971_t:CDS:2 [Acaulospora morrowiae]|uniref:7971_t:CDS:1 n=1 Tax=Acaulospora morrowiae TaxID=94023 RepID=A0A9N9B5S2_9GLOM|nr:7971_t:CDS:2 [Acaulospora morrowiae]